MECRIFNKGDEVPQWVEKTSNCHLVFGADVQVEATGEGVAVYPIRGLDENQNIMVCSAINDEQSFSIIGAPTMIFTNPRDVENVS